MLPGIDNCIRFITKPYIGVSVTDVSRETQSYGLPKGAAVRSVAEDSPAAAAGLEENDIITAINGEEISGSKALVDKVRDAFYYWTFLPFVQDAILYNISFENLCKFMIKYFLQM